MITFWTDELGRSNFHDFLRGKADSTYPTIATALYADLGPTQSLNSAAHVFAALDQLRPAGAAAVASMWDQLSTSAPGVRLLNDPRRVLHRYELLTALADAGLNSFRAFKPSDDLGRLRFPVFIREERRHTGAWALIHTRQDLDRALTALVARGFRREELLVVEFCDTSDRSGVFRKFGAMKIGDRILPRHMMIGREWMLKASGNLRTLEAAREQLAYVKENPHEAWLREVFRIANIDYGRVDYAVLGDTPQIWEINLDPSLGGGGQGDMSNPEFARLAQERRTVASRAMSEAWRALESGPVPGETTVVFGAGLLGAIRRENDRKRWRKKALAFGQWCADRPILGWPLRWTYRKLFPGPTVFRMP